MRFNFITVFILSLMLSSLFVSNSTAGGNVRTGILPSNPIEGDSIQIGIESQLNPCLAIFDAPPFYHLSENNEITFVVAALGVEPCPNVAGFSYLSEIGPLPVGTYSVQVYNVDFPSGLPSSINDPLGFPLDDGFTFEVSGAPTPTPVPSLSFYGILALITAFLILGLKLKGINYNMTSRIK